jgi:hypothetical protein
VNEIKSSHWSDSVKISRNWDTYYTDKNSIMSKWRNELISCSWSFNYFESCPWSMFLLFYEIDEDFDEDE